MNRLEKIRDELAHDAYFESMDRDAGNAGEASFINGWNACAAEYEKMIEDLENSLLVIRHNLIGHKGNGESLERIDDTIQKLKEWRGE